MSSKRLEERNEKVIRGLMKLPPNRRCMNCNSLGPQYVCTNFWTFVCTACSGIHREFTHRVKSVSMATFTTQEVEALQNGGNQCARDTFLKEWDMHTMRFPDNSYPDKIREFIKKVYVDKKYAGVISSDKPPRDPQDLKSHEEQRRASSYHSYSQSPPYDHQYEDRRYGKPKNMLTRKPGSAHGCYDGNMCNILYSPGHGREHMNEDRFANEFSGSRVSDFSSSTASDPFRSGCQSPNGYSSSSSRQRSTSSGSFGSFDGNTAYPKSTISGAFSDMVFEPEHASISQPPKNFTISSSETYNPASASHNLFGAQYLQHQITKPSAADFFADFSNPTSCTSPTEDKPPALIFSESQQWASFDTAHQVKEPVPEANKGFSSGFPARINDSTESAAIFLSTVDYSEQFLVHNSTTQGELASSSNQRSAGINESHKSMDSNCPQVWNALNDLFASNSEALPTISSHGSEVLVAKPSISADHCTNVVVSKEAEDELQVPIQVDDSYMLGLQISSPFELLPSAALPCEVRTTQGCKSANPFDAPYDLDPGAGKMFLDMSSLQGGALPNPQLPNTFVDGFSDPWFHKSSTSTFIPAPQAFSYAGGQITSSQFPNPPAQGSVASLGGNPFA